MTGESKIPTRILCVQVPLFPLAARLRSEPELRGEAVVVTAGAGSAARVVAATRRARRAGVRPGFTLSQARARLPKVIARPRDDASERAAQEAMLDVAESFSPRVEDAGEGLLYLDAEGLSRLHPGDEPELALARALVLAMERQAELPVRVGVGSSKLTARLAAQQPDTPTVVVPGREVELLGPLPLDQVTPQASTLAVLERWGIRSVGELARLPEAEVISRLGEAGRELHAIARGEDPRPLVPRTVPDTFSEGMELEWPLVSLEPFLFVARAALDRMTRRMALRGLGCRRLQVTMELEPDGHHARTLDLPAPTRDVKTLLTLLRLDLEANPPGAPILGFELVAHPDKPRGAQLSLFGPEDLSPDKLATTLARLFALLGNDRVGSPRTVDAHRPERFTLEPYAPPPPPKVRRATRPGRGLLTVRVLRPPLPVEVMTESAEPPKPAEGTGPRATDDAAPRAADRPVSIQTVAGDATTGKPKIHGAVKVASGPWGMEEEWWSERPLERDYWDVELATGGLYRLYRERQTGDWFLDGIYD